MLFTIRTMTQYEMAQFGVTWDTLWNEYENFSVAHGFIMLLIDFAYLSILGFYLEGILPKTYGQRKGLCFCFVSSCCKRKGPSIKDSGSKTPDANLAASVAP